MKRRRFIGAAAGSAVAAGGLSSPAEAFIGRTASDRTRLGKHTYTELFEHYKTELYEDYLMISNNYSVDHELGGFICDLDDALNVLNDRKRLWFLGRGIWGYSFLYNNIEPNPLYAEIATKAVDFTLKNAPRDMEIWPPFFSREGVPGGNDNRIYGMIFLAEGLAEFSKIKGNEKYWDEAKQILIRMVNKYDRDPDYFHVGSEEQGNYIQRARVQGHWMVFLNNTTQMLNTRPEDRDLKAICDRSIDALINYHYHPEYRLNTEYLNHDLSRPNNSFARQVHIGHAVEIYWMLMHEAVRRKDRTLFDTAASRLKRHMEVGWDNVYGGFFRMLEDVEANLFELDKIMYVQTECLIGLACIVEHTGEQWAKDWYERVYTYFWEVFPKRKYGFPGVMGTTDRKGGFRPDRRFENYHHPRHLMYNYLALERLASRKGKTSGVFG